MTKIKAHVFISGRVQHVFFRNATQNQAKKLSVFGWVKNLDDGRVEAVFEGNKENIEKMIEWAKEGSFLAKVENVEIIFEDYKGEFDSFEKTD